MVASGMLLTTGADAVTVNFQVSSSIPAEFLARIVTVWGLPATTGLGQETTPVAGLIVIPEGLATSDHVIGGVPWLRAGVGPV